MPPIELVSAADGRFFPGLLVALGSAIASASGNFDYSVTVLDGGISSKDWKCMAFHLQRIGAEKKIELTLSRIDATGPLMEGMPSRRGSSLTYARLVIPTILKVPKAIYIDSDVVCLRGVEEFWTGLETGAPLVAVRDPLGVLGRDPLTRRLPRSKHKLPYFNAGIIGMNLKSWAEPQFQSQITKLLPDAASFRYVDQSLLNLVFNDCWLELPDECNRLLTLAACGKMGTDTELANYHYIGGRKPWLSTVSNFYRHAPNLLFDQMVSWICSVGQIQRTICPKSISTARRKRLLYRLVLPHRARQYADALKATSNAADVVQHLVANRNRSFSPPITVQP